MRLVITSDTHGKHSLIPKLPDGDIFVHAGVFMNSGLYPEEVTNAFAQSQSKPQTATPYI